MESKNLDASQLNYAKYDMDSEVKYWSDFMELKYHDRTYLTIPPYLQNIKPPSDEPNEWSEDFGSYSDGINVSRDKDFNERFYESVRHFCEEANFIQVSSQLKKIFETRRIFNDTIFFFSFLKGFSTVHRFV